jgi:MFS family permease
MAAVVRLLVTPDSLLLSAMYAFTGVELSFWTGSFTLLLPTDAIGLVLTFAGVGEIVGGLAFGRISDVLGRSVSLSLGTALFSLALGLTCWMRSAGAGMEPQLDGAPGVAYAAALCFGLADSAFNTNVFAIIGQIYGDDEWQERAAHHEFDAIDGDGKLPAAAAVRDDGAGGALVFSGSAVGSVSGGGGGDDREALLLGGGAYGDDGAPPRHPRFDVGGTSLSAFTAFQLFQNVASCGFYFLAEAYPVAGAGSTLTLVWVQVALLAVGTVTFIAADVRDVRRKAAAHSEG